MDTYELMVLYDTELKEDGVKKEIISLKGKIKEANGKVTEEDYWGIKNLAYEIKKRTTGYYDVLKIEIDPEQVSELSRWLKLQGDKVLRSLLTKV